MANAAFNIASPNDYQRIFNQAELLRDNGDISEAIMAYTSLLRYRLEWEQREPGQLFTINEVFIVDRLADFALLTGNKTAARHLLTAMDQLLRRLGNITMRIHVATKLFFINLNDGQLDNAIDNIQSLSEVIGDVKNIQISPSGLPEWENRVQFDPRCSAQDEADQFVCLYDALGALLLALGRFAEGALMLQRGIQIGEQHRSPLVDSRLLSMKILHVKALFQKGEVNLAKGNLSKIEHEAEGAGIASGIPIQLLDIKSKIALSEGEMGEACRLVYKTAQVCRQYHLMLPEIKANFNLAQTKVLLNQVNDAIEILQDCLIRSQKLGETNLTNRINRFLQVAENRTQAALPVLNYSRNIRQQKPPDVSIPQSESAPGNYRRSEDYLGFFEEKSLILQLYLAENDYEKASELLAYLRLLVSHCDSTLIHTRFQVLEFMMLYFTNASIPEKFPFEEILEFFTKNHFLPELWQFRRLLGHTAFVPETQKNAWAKENQLLLDQITASLPPTMQALYLLNKWSPNEEYLAGFSDDLLQLKHKIQLTNFPPSRWWATWNLMKRSHVFQEESKRYKDHLARSIGGGIRAGEFAFSRFASGFIRKLWRQPKATLTVSFLVLPDRVIIISRSFLKIRFHTTTISRVVLRQLVFDLRDWLYPEGKFRDTESATVKADKTAADADVLLHHLAEILQIDNILKEHGKGVRHIRFLADDVLHGFPFTILSWKGAGLLDFFSVYLSTDDSLLKRKQVEFFGKNILMIGVSKAVAGLNRLPGVSTEIHEIMRSLQTSGAVVQILLDEVGMAEATKKYLPEADMAHFSCHGKFDYRHPERSGLVLSDDEIFTIRDILDFPDLSRLRLLVLSSCRGAEHFVLPGRWIIGLPETFCRAGVQAVLAFLWPVEDAFAMVFTIRFYEYLRNNPPAESFRLTVLDARNKKFPELNSEYWHPKFWAGATFFER